LGEGGQGLGAEPPAAGGHWGLEAKPPNAGGKGLWGAELPALGYFCNYSIKSTHFYAYFSQNRYFKTITSIKNVKISLNVISRTNECN